MTTYNLANVMGGGMSGDSLNSMFADPRFQTQFASMFANNPALQSGLGNLYTNNPAFRSAFGTLANQGYGGQTSGAPTTPQGLPPSAYATMYQPPSMLNLGIDPNTGHYGMTSSAPQAPNQNMSIYDPQSFAQMNTPQQTMAGLQAQQNAQIQKKSGGGGGILGTITSLLPAVASIATNPGVDAAAASLFAMI